MTRLDRGRPSPAGSLGAAPSELPPFAEVCRRIAAAEAGEGWLVECEAAGRFLVPCRELIDALAAVLRRLVGEGGPPVLEVCAGAGELAAALCQAGVAVEPCDVDPPAGSHVLRATADEALEKFHPAVVLGVFVPIDAGVDEAVLRFSTVRHYVVIGARLGGLFGSAALWRHPQWIAESLDDVARWLLTRHDVWFDSADPCILRHGEAWHFRVES